jgi:hypothetical protein
MEDKQEMTIQGQALFDEAKIDFQILDQELETFLLHIKQLQNKLDNIQMQ